MKKILYSLPIAAALLFSINLSTASADDQVIPDNAGQLTAPQNTQCRSINFDSVSGSGDIKRTPPDSGTTINGVNYDGTQNIYDLCIGSFPRYPSTKVEGGIMPYYYLKYYLIPDPMPVYSITETPVTMNGTTINGLNQTFTMNTSVEASNKPSDKNIFLFYPYDATHDTSAPTPSSYIRGPYQIGYNSYYHNTYRARYFASQVKFNFTVLNPLKGKNYTSDGGTNYTDKTPLFQGTIIYDIPDSCYNQNYLDYNNNCRSIEFYFPKGSVDTSQNPPYFTGNVTNTIGTTSSSNSTDRNVIPKDRLPYMNPGEHNLIVDAVENTQLRVQKDLGTEYQTVGNPNNVQGSQSPWKDYVVYFSRGDKDLLGNSISPLSTITQIPAHSGKSIANNTIQDSSRMITDYNSTTGEWTYDTQKNADWLNYCDYNTNTWSGVDTSNRTDNNGTPTTRSNQTDKTCYHNDSSDTHFWQYDWSKTAWYALDPRPASFVQNN